MSSEKIVTLFDTPEHARAAQHNLIKAGFDENNISIIEGHHISDHTASGDDTSIWKKLFGKDVEDECAQIYSEAVRTNGAVLSVKVKGEDERATALAILNRHQTVDIASRDRLQSYAAETAKLPATEPAKLSATETEKTERPWLTGNESKDEILRLAKEELEVGKRLVKEGTTRIRRYVTEENVSKTVNLREQHAEILRKPVNRLVDEKEVDWSEKEIVVEEMAEKPVINKSVHITEDVAVRKNSTDHDEKISDTVRSQHIEVERQRADEKKAPFTKK